ncbi:hypothetical protein E1A91_A11G070600v1 [Gossypium mustelinum]|uniref:AAA+ ATPase domain-containing protein n=4 Tax=Gossypium TaxID=3633 RepID=A0A2P5XA00_GOSBA|nr:hypothetical protein ES319_A11G070300v1 [Gossypium barbadense]PPS00147.1 hypothetical protein GOBAR_AA20522 [Gossypium barbadense]TYG92943.1 hypothetical protein ES288_A11G072100v1 [Gossypium darwinii]TYH99528.1 hypothetical protein ES332_A11G072300v1 [Gossypium tomentosum]TYJ08380.1 hypothetical protein E1A91_A11G070600v1 [Gossypium mustelinum]
MAKELGEEITKKPLIIAMKGHPGTGKSTLAHALASALKFPLVDKDDIRDSTFPLHQQPQGSHTLLNHLSYEAIWRVASTQLHLGISVIIDSPLSHRTHLDRLISLAASAGARLLIVECRPSDEAKWRERLEGREKSWHKPNSWEELQELIKGYGGCTEYDVGDVPKMVVDTTAPNLGVEELVSSVVRFIASS